MSNIIKWTAEQKFHNEETAESIRKKGQEYIHVLMEIVDNDDYYGYHTIKVKDRVVYK